ncbi:hypothetical protein M422DRAFT_265480 [Sphaerobolus stellatus SS14]|uniref:Uncharacterized protein n=1 Tax=Sphaerobolus stellatus (strain SS14) TaxID=990650 RepID=A0A0C9V5N9_SPHS4|nr:hypothetical protein M422DRAFT_265480 [Sphaerobolus stellatus SS14]
MAEAGSGTLSSKSSFIFLHRLPRTSRNSSALESRASNSSLLTIRQRPPCPNWEHRSPAQLDPVPDWDTYHGVALSLFFLFCYLGLHPPQTLKTLNDPDSVQTVPKPTPIESAHNALGFSSLFKIFISYLPRCGSSFSVQCWAENVSRAYRFTIVRTRMIDLGS